MERMGGCEKKVALGGGGGGGGRGELRYGGVVWCGVVWCGVVWCGVVSGTCDAGAGPDEGGDVRGSQVDLTHIVGVLLCNVQPPPGLVYGDVGGVDAGRGGRTQVPGTGPHSIARKRRDDTSASTYISDHKIVPICDVYIRAGIDRQPCWIGQQ